MLIATSGRIPRNAAFARRRKSTRLVVVPTLGTIGEVVMKCRLLHAVHLPAVDGVVARDGAVLVEILVTDGRGVVPDSIWQAGQRGLDQKLIEPCLRAANRNEVVGEYSDAAAAIDRHADFCVIGVLRGYSKSEPIITPGGRLDIRLAEAVPPHLASLFEHCNRRELATWDDD